MTWCFFQCLILHSMRGLQVDLLLQRAWGRGLETSVVLYLSMKNSLAVNIWLLILL